MEEKIFDARRQTSKVSCMLKENRINKLRGESAEKKLLRAIKLHELGRQLSEVNSCAGKYNKHN